MKKVAPILILAFLFAFTSCNLFKNAKCTECPEWTEKQPASKAEATVAHNGNSYCTD